MNRAARLNIAREDMVKPETFWKSILWTDESKIELFRENPILRTKHSFQQWIVEVEMLSSEADFLPLNRDDEIMDPKH